MRVGRHSQNLEEQTLKAISKFLNTLDAFEEKFFVWLQIMEVCIHLQLDWNWTICMQHTGAAVQYVLAYLPQIISERLSLHKIRWTVRRALKLRLCPAKLKIILFG